MEYKETDGTHIELVIDGPGVTRADFGVQMLFCMEPEVLCDEGIHIEFSFDFQLPEKKEPAPKKKRGRKKGKKQNKILNNSYRSGDNLKGDSYKFDKEVRVERGYASNNLGHIYDPENSMTYQKIRTEVLRLLDTNKELIDMLSDEKPKKFNREKVNRMFKIICEHFEKNPKIRQFMNVIYIFDNVSNLSGLRYSSLYDLLDGEYKQMLLIELDSTHNILGDSGKNNKLF